MTNNLEKNDISITLYFNKTYCFHQRVNLTLHLIAMLHYCHQLLEKADTHGLRTNERRIFKPY